MSLILKDERISHVMLPFIKLMAPFSKLKPEDIAYVPLKGGSKACLYRFELNDYHYVLRLLPPHTENHVCLHQIHLATQAGKMGVGPEVYFVDTQMVGMVMEFISGHTSKPQDFDKPDHLTHFAKFIQKLHQSSEEFPLACSPFQRFNDFIRKGEEKKIVYPARFGELNILMRELEIIFRLSPFPLVPSHLDLHPLNIMFTEKQFYLVDWVNGGMSDRFFDLATFTLFHHLNAHQTQLFLSSYFNRDPTQYEYSRFIVTQPIRLFVIAAALLTLSTDMPAGIAYEEAFQSLEIPSMENLDKKESNVPVWLRGLTMYKAGLALIDRDVFKSALSELHALNSSSIF